MGLRELLTTINDPRHTAMVRIYDRYAHLIHHAKGSSHNHQAWPGGYADHIAEIININRVTYPALHSYRPLPFTMAQADIALYLHDIEKPFKYGPSTDPDVLHWTQVANNYMLDQIYPDEYAAWEQTKWDILHYLQIEYNYRLDPDETNALTYTHGEGAAHRKDQRVTCPLAAHVHHCDNTSARIYPEDGRNTG